MGGKVRVQGKDRGQARALLADALAVQEAGAFAIVLELVPEQLAAAITERLRIPTIGIGAGAGCSGQVQVITDLLGLGDFMPRHAAPYADLRGTIADAARPTPPTSRPARSRATRRRCGWTTRCSTRSSGAGDDRDRRRRRTNARGRDPARPRPLSTRPMTAGSPRPRRRPRP